VENEGQIPLSWSYALATKWACFFSVHTVVLDDAFHSSIPDVLLFLVIH